MPERDNENFYPEGITPNEHENDPEECNHENKSPGSVDTSQPQEMFEDWYCPDCGATLSVVYKPAVVRVYRNSEQVDTIDPDDFY